LAEELPEVEAERPAIAGRLARLAVDITPLRTSRPFRRLWFGTGISAIGSQITSVAIPIQVYDLTHSTLLVGLISIAGLVPILIVPLYAGAVADAVDRRRLLLFSDVALALVSVGLLANALLPSPRVWALFVFEALATGAYGFQRPARNALTPRLVGEEQLTAAIAIEDTVFNLAHVAGPALGGVLVAVIGFEGAYGADLATFAASMLSIWLLPRVPPMPDAERPSLRSIAEGFRYIKMRPVLLGIFVADTNAMIFGMPEALFPAFGVHLGGGAETVGFLYAAPWIGAFVASAVAGVDPRVMGIGPVPAVRKLLERVGVDVADLDLVELNEAFASQSVAVIRELGLDPEKVNVNGGAIAIGHPLGMSGARLVVTLLHELRRRGGRYGVATMCVGVGQGQAALFERAA